MRPSVVLVLAVLLIAPQQTLALQKQVSPEIEEKALRELMSTVPLGSRVKVRTKEGRRLTATLLSVLPDEIVLKRDTRVPEPAVSIRFEEIAGLQRAENGRGMSIGKAIGIGLAAGAGAMLTMIAIFATVD